MVDVLTYVCYLHTILVLHAPALISLFFLLIIKLVNLIVLIDNLHAAEMTLSVSQNSGIATESGIAVMVAMNPEKKFAVSYFLPCFFLEGNFHSLVDFFAKDFTLESFFFFFFVIHRWFFRTSNLCCWRISMQQSQLHTTIPVMRWQRWLWWWFRWGNYFRFPWNFYEFFST